MLNSATISFVLFSSVLHQNPAHAPTDVTSSGQTKGMRPPIGNTGSLAGKALWSEVERSAEKNYAALVRLEKLKKEIDVGRQQMQVETDRLEILLRKSEGAGGCLEQNQDDPVVIDKQMLKAVSNMKSSKAAAVIERMDLRMATALLRDLKPRVTGGILGALNPDKAAEIVGEMAKTAASAKQEPPGEAP